MKYLVDTHVLLWFILGDKRLSSTHIDQLSDSKNNILVSSASIWEIAIKLSIGKLKLNTEFTGLIEYLHDNDYQILNYDPDDLNTMIRLPFYHQDPFDRLIIAQSMTKKLTILSDDEKFKKYDIYVI